jgi:hypothetical protein
LDYGDLDANGLFAAIRDGMNGRSFKQPYLSTKPEPNYFQMITG